MTQYLYLIKSQNFCKIGITSNLTDRLVNLQAGNPHKIDLVSCYEFPDMYTSYRVEQKFHKILSQYHVRGEWFELDDIALDLVKMCLSCIAWLEKDKEQP